MHSSMKKQDMNIDSQNNVELNGACIIAYADGSRTWGQYHDGKKIGLWTTNMYDVLRSVEYYEPDGQLNKKRTSALNGVIARHSLQVAVANFFGKKSWLPKNDVPTTVQRKLDSYTL